MKKENFETSNTSPFVKWAGGKRQLLPEIKKMLPETFKTYYEPFVGGGAVLFELQPKKAVFGDINEELVGTYKNIKENKDELIELLDEYTKNHNDAKDKKEYFYSLRDEYNEEILVNPSSVKCSALFIYLNKTCFNGLYRVNANGLFNVPFNNKEKVRLYNLDNLNNISKYLKNAKIKCCDFEETCKNAKKEDFVFFDSPYAPLKDTSFESYTKEGFSLENHQRLARLYKKLSDKGVYCMLTNHNTDLINELYKDFNIKAVQVKRLINSDANNRKGEEVIITNY